MRAVVITKPGGPEVLEVREVEAPRAGPGQVRVRIHACAVNRADLMQVRGMYPAPADAPQDIPGLEVAGEIDELGSGVMELAIGDRVYGVVSGGAYAEWVVVPARTLARMPKELDFVQAAAVPEAFVTAYDAMVLRAGLAAGDVALVNAAGSGVGTAAVQIARAIGARSIGTARTASKLEKARELGMSEGVVVTAKKDGQPDFASKVMELTEGRGADVCLELVGGAYVPESLRALAMRGRLVLVGLLAGVAAEIDLSLVLRRRLMMVGTMLRARPLEEKILAAQTLAHNLTPLFASGTLKPIVERVFKLEEAGAAHAYLAANEGFGKLVLKI
jgi:putative PIG3 family NAD(P)H quinone oxidoreductase